MKSVLAVLLLALAPFSSLRMVCVTSHDLVARTNAADAAAEAECERVCRRHARPRPAPPPSGNIDCLLVADPSCEYIGAGATAVLPSAPALTRDERIGTIDRFVVAPYASAVPSRLTPPPKSRA